MAQIIQISSAAFFQLKMHKRKTQTLGLGAKSLQFQLKKALTQSNIVTSDVHQ